MSVLLGEVMKALRYDPEAYDKLAGGNGGDAEIIDLSGSAGTKNNGVGNDLLDQLKQASSEIDEINNAIASNDIGNSDPSEKANPGDGNAPEKKAQLDDDDVKTNIKEYLINGVIKEAADEGILEASRAMFEKEAPIYSRYIKSAVWRVKTSSLSNPMKKLVYYGLASLGGGALGAGAVALKSHSDLNKYRKQVANAFMEDETMDQKKMYDVARRAYQLGLMRAGKVGK